MKKYSLKSKITRSIALLFVVFWVVITSALVALVVKGVSEIAKEEIALEAELIAQLYAVSIRDQNQVFDPVSNTSKIVSLLFAADIKREFQVWHKGALVVKTEGALIEARPFKQGFEHRNDDASGPEVFIWRYNVPAEDIWVIVSQDVGEISPQAFEPLIPVFLVLIFLLPAVILSLSTITNRLFSPVAILADQIRNHGVSGTEKIPDDNIPEELEPLVHALNSLIKTQQNAIDETNRVLDQEKRFTANAAHELLTPLAAIKSEVQQQIRETVSSSDENTTVQKALHEIEGRVDRAVHTVEQLVTLARLDPQTAPQKFEYVNLTGQLQIVTASLANEIERKEIELCMSEEKETILGIPSTINILCRNILDNAIRYTPVGGKITILIAKDNSTVVLSVRNDTSAPIPDYLLDNIFERFVRGPKEKETGSGLGLSIVKRIVDIHNIPVELRNVDNGVEISISFSANGC